MGSFYRQPQNPFAERGVARSSSRHTGILPRHVGGVGSATVGGTNVGSSTISGGKTRGLVIQICCFVIVGTVCISVLSLAIFPANQIQKKLDLLAQGVESRKGGGVRNHLSLRASVLEADTALSTSKPKAIDTAKFDNEDAEDETTDTMDKEVNQAAHVDPEDQVGQVPPPKIIGEAKEIVKKEHDIEMKQDAISDHAFGRSKDDNSTDTGTSSHGHSDISNEPEAADEAALDEVRVASMKSESRKDSEAAAKDKDEHDEVKEVGLVGGEVAAIESKQQNDTGVTAES